MRKHSLVMAMAAVLVATSASHALAQAPLNENHYKVYNSTPITAVRDLKLTDQFGSFKVTDIIFDRFATPVEKNHAGVVYPMVEPGRHLDWWRLTSPQPSRTVMVKDQFGQNLWTVGNAAYLLAPARKNQAPGDTLYENSNHYVCYEVTDGPTIGTPVLVIDQFGNAQITVLHAKYFCNPAQKEVDGGFGGIWFIEDPIVHLACYQVENPSLDIHSIIAHDQFGFWPTQIFRNDCLCAPALKDHVLRTERTTWGKVKALYRN